MVNKTQYDEIELQKKAPSDRIRNSCEDDTSPESSDSDDSSNDSSTYVEESFEVMFVPKEEIQQVNQL